MPRYLVELYVPRSDDPHASASARRAEAAADELASEGASIRYVRTTFLPDDETCFHIFEALSLELVEEAVERGALGRARVTPAIES